MQIDRNVGFLCSVDLKKIILSQSKKQIQSSNSIDFRSSVQRSASIQVSLNHSFAFETLITNIEVIWSNPNSLQTNFENIQVEVSSLSSRGLYGQLINLKTDKQPNTLTFTGAGLTQNLKVNLWLKQDQKKKSFRPPQKQFLQSTQKLISETIKQINIYGVTINSNPSSILLTKLLNVSELFKKYNLFQQAAQTDILVALSLINARRFVLAAQILRKVSKYYVQKYNSTKSMLDVSRSQRSGFREIQEEVGFSTTRANFGSGRTLEGNKFLQRAAKIQLLIAETVSHPSLVFQKLQAYHRCNAYACGNVSPTALHPDADLQQIALSIFPQIVIFLLKILSDKLQPFRIASLKSIQFFIQTLGCSIGQSFLQILKQSIHTYPTPFPQTNPNKIPYGLQEVDISLQKNPSSEIESGIPLTKNKILMDHYHHLLETLLSLMGLINRKMIICAFSEIITVSILGKDVSLELRLYLLRFAERSVLLCGADLVIQVSFVGLLLSLCQQKNVSKLFNTNNLSAQKSQGRGGQNLKKKQEGSATQNKQIIHNLMHFSQKILANIKIKILPRYSGHKMQSFLEWINKTLSYFGQNDMLSNSNSSHSLFVFTSILDFISLSYSVLKYDHSRLTHSPIQTILYFLNLAIYNQQNGLPFDKILDTFITLLKFHCKMDSNFELDEEMISRILLKSKQHNLSLKQLQILIKVLEVCEQHSQMMLQWLEIYLGCIPHSTYDETYKVFCIMLTKGIKNIQEYPKKQQLLKKIVKTMLDQYTVKGKAHQQAKQTLIDCLIKNKSGNIQNLIQICLFENHQPKPQNYYSKRKPRASEKGKKDVEHRFDSKSYKIDYQMFLQKISLAQMILTTICSSKKSQKHLHLQLLTSNFTQTFFSNIKLLLQSPSFKLKNKAISLINYFIEISRSSWKQNAFKIREFVLIVRNIFGVSRMLVGKLKESKLLYSPIYNLISVYKCYQIQEGGSGIFDPEQIQKIYEEVEEKLKNQDNWGEPVIHKNKGQRIVSLVMLREFIKIWSNLSVALISSWENVRDIYILLIVEVFKQGLFFIPMALKKKVVDMTRALIVNLFKSQQHNQRNAALKIFGTMIGLRVTAENKDNFLGNMIKENLKYMKPFLEKVYDLTFDWDEKNVQISQNLCEICISEQTKCTLNDRRTQKNSRKNPSMQHSYLSFNLQQELNFQKKNSSLSSNIIDNQFLRESWVFEEDLPVSPEETYNPNITEELLNKIYQFRNLIDKDLQTKTQVFVEKESFLEQNQEQFYDMGEEKAESVEAKEKSQDDQLEFQDLGIIELDDEQWSQEEEKSQKAIQKLPLKKIYKLSPSVLNASKPQRIRSKRFHQNQFEYREKIIVDELQQKITNSQGISDSQSIPHKPQGYPQQNSNGFVFNNQLIPKEAEKREEKTVQKGEKNQKSERSERSERNERNERKQRMEYNKHNLVMEPLIIDDYEMKQEQRDEDIYEDTRNRDKWQKQLKKQKQTAEKEIYQMSSARQKQSDKKSKKPSAKKRKASTGK